MMVSPQFGSLTTSLERVLGVKRQATDRPVRTPPYKVPYPDVTIRNLRPQKGEELRFIILATDGYELSL